QRDGHASDLGTPVLPESGSGVIRNVQIQEVRGLVEVAPFANDRSCLSLLDRRFWIFDQKLDVLTPSGSSTPYTAYQDASGGGRVRPVLPDRIEQTVQNRDRLRQTRFSWIKSRTELVNGTLPQLDRIDDEIAKDLEEQLDLLLRTINGQS
ncbi:MAG: hypothetical protein AAGM67_14830, partial [Bacteroidota bacterium]